MTEVEMYVWDSAFGALSLIEPDARTSPNVSFQTTLKKTNQSSHRFGC